MSETATQFDHAKLPGAGVVRLGYFELAEAFGLSFAEALQCLADRAGFDMRVEAKPHTVLAGLIQLAPQEIEATL